LKLFGYEPGYLVYATTTFLTLATSLTLFPLGQRLFNFFDLKPLIEGELLPRIAKHIEGATRLNSSMSVSNYNSQEARRLFDQFIYLDDILKMDSRAIASNLLPITNGYTSILSFYLRKKHRIDSKSYWFPRRQKHTQWFFAGDSATTMALNTSSQLMPEQHPDLNWLETEILKRLRGHIELAFVQNEYDLALRLLARLSSRISMYSHGFHFEIGMSEIIGLRSLIETALSQKTIANEEHKKTIVAIADNWAALGSNLCLETLRRMMTFEKELAGFFEKDRWTTDAIRTLPTFLQLDIAFIVTRIEFEQQAEGRRLSQPKYLQQLVIQKLLGAYEKMLPLICDFHQKQVGEFAENLLKAKLPEAATQVLLASLHADWKLPRWFEDLSQLLSRYKAYEHYNEKQYILPTINTEKMTGGFATARDKTLETLGSPELSSHIFSDKQDEDLPDHFGQIYYALAEECIYALADNQPDKLNKVIRTFMKLAIVASDIKFTNPNLSVSTEFRLHLISTVIQDMASIMGFSIVYGEYYGNSRLEELTLGAFFSLIDKFSDKTQYLTRMLRLSDTTNFSWSASPRDLIRTNWKMQFEGRAREDGYGDQLSYDRSKDHTSKLVNEFLSAHADASSLFFALKVLPLIGDVDFKFNRYIGYFAERLANNDREGPQ